MDENYGRQYRELYNGHWWWRARESLITSIVDGIRRDGNHGPILDVGCGDGLFLDRLSQFGEVDGIEADGYQVSDDNPWKQRIHIGPFDDQFQPGKRYSLILMLDVLEHFSDPRSCLARAQELLDSAGTLLITVPAFCCLWTTHDDLNHHKTRYTKSTLAEVIEYAGVKIVSTRYFFHWAFPTKLLIHYKERIFPTNPRIPEVPGRLVNESLYWLSVLEQRVFGLLPLPFGSSLLAVCSK